MNVDHVRLTLVGRWLDRSAADEEELLVVQVDGRRHRFIASRDAPQDDRGHWSATSTLPTWAEPRHDGQAALWLGNAVIPVPLPRSPAGPVVAPAALPVVAPAALPAVAPVALPAVAPAALAAAAPAALLAPPSSDAESESESEAWRPPVGRAAADPHRAGPLADLLLKETVAALQAELEQRTVAAVRTRGELADAQSGLRARTATQMTLEATQTQLRAELERLSAAIDHQRAELEAHAAKIGSAEVVTLREQVRVAEAEAERRAAEAGQRGAELAAANVARDAAVNEAAGLRAELGRLGTELAATRERVDAEGGDLGEAQRLLADAKALAEQLRDPGTSA